MLLAGGAGLNRGNFFLQICTGSCCHVHQFEPPTCPSIELKESKVNQICHSKVKSQQSKLKVENWKSRIKKVSDATYISDVIFKYHGHWSTSHVSWKHKIKPHIIVSLGQFFSSFYRIYRSRKILCTTTVGVDSSANVTLVAASKQALPRVSSRLEEYDNYWRKDQREV